jgi:hypothetical protein
MSCIGKPYPRSFREKTSVQLSWIMGYYWALWVLSSPDGVLVAGLPPSVLSMDGTFCAALGCFVLGLIRGLGRSEEMAYEL